MSIDELYEKVEELDKKISDESKERRKRRRQLKHQLGQLEDERTHFGNKHDFDSVLKVNSQINNLKGEMDSNISIDRLKTEKQNYERQILEIVVDYYKKGYAIEDVIKSEDICNDKLKKWFETIDFGANSGYLFVEFVEDGEFNWKYSNPINKVNFKSMTLDDLCSKINGNNEILLIFDDDLAKKSQEKDLLYYKDFIDAKLSELERLSFGYTTAKSLLIDLKPFSDKFSKEQIEKLCHISIYNSQIYRCFICTPHLMHIINRNKNLIDSELYQRVKMMN